jgi:hypothetical protein
MMMLFMKSIEVNKIWEEQGYDPLDGFCWYRLHVVIPSELKTNASLKDSLLIYWAKSIIMIKLFLMDI